MKERQCLNVKRKVQELHKKFTKWIQTSDQWHFVIPVWGTLALQVYVPASSLEKTYSIIPNFLLLRIVWWRLLNCQFECLNTWLSGFESVDTVVACSIWTLFKHWLFDFPPKSWGMLTVVEGEISCKLELFSLKFCLTNKL